MRQAQLTMLRRYDASGQKLRGLKLLDNPDTLPGSSPYFWACFVLSGDWRQPLVSRRRQPRV